MSKEKTTIPSLEATVTALEKKYGDGVVLRNDEGPTNVKVISSGCYSIDRMLGCGGLPLGRTIEIYGMESSGKSTLCLFFAAQIQKQGGKVVYLDVEQTYDRRYAEAIGVSTAAENFIVSQPSTLEETFDILRAFVATNEIDLIIVDSVAAMIPKKNLEEGDLEKEEMAVKARLMSKYLPVITAEIARSKTIVIFINQMRSNVGTMYGPRDTTPGGRALKFYASIRLSVTRKEAIMAGKEQIGNTVQIVAKKNKVSFPFREAFIDIYYGSGVDLESDLVEAAIDYEMITREANTYKYFDGTKLGVGKEQVKKYVKENPEFLEKLKKDLDKREVGPK